MVLRIIVDLLQAYLIVLFVRIMLTWFPIDPWSRLARVEREIGKVTDPPLTQLRRVIPSARIGSMNLDLSPIVLFVIIIILIDLL